MKDMTLNEYQLLAARTIRADLTREEVIQHALLLIPAEYGELASLHQKELQGHDFNMEHAKKELGDIAWGIAEYATAMHWTLDDVFQTNIDKLRARYPDGFDTEHSIHRKANDI